jgi:hypothetical protein
MPAHRRREAVVTSPQEGAARRCIAQETLFAAALVGAAVVLPNTEFRTQALADVLSSHEIAAVICDHELRIACADKRVFRLRKATRFREHRNSVI